MENNKKTEFDDYAKNYQYGFDNPIKKLFGHKPDVFFDIKIKWLRNFLENNYSLSDYKKIEVLDFGCGTGLFFKKINDLNLNINLSGVDISKEMLNTAIDYTSSNRLYLLNDKFKNENNNHYDLIIVSSVLHHINKKQRSDTFDDLNNLLKENGHLIIFEHNPLNPLTSFVIKNTKIDKNAVLISPKEIMNYFKEIKIGFIDLNYLMFFPPRFDSKIIEIIEKKMAHIPFGAQYVIVGKKPNQ